MKTLINSIVWLAIGLCSCYGQDLTVKTFTTQAPHIYKGGSLKVYLEMQNIGSSATVSNFVNIYLTKDSVNLSLYGDIHSFVMPALQPGATTVLQQTFTLPSYIEGPYFLVAYLDYRGLQAEQNEANNSAKVKILVGYGGFDLKPTALNTSSNAIFSYDNVSTSVSCKNLGFQKSPATEIAYYLSTDTLLGGDYFIGRNTLSALTEGTSTNINTNVTIPNVSAGKYYILAEANYVGTNNYSESNRTNNVTYCPVNVNMPPYTTIPSMGSTQLTTCNAVIFDNSGPLSSYQTIGDGSITIYPAQPNHDVVLNFDYISVEANYGNIYVYDGAYASGQPRYTLNTAYTSSIRATNPQGALTIRYVSSKESIGYQGFKARVSCQSREVLLPDFAISSVNVASVLNAGESFTPTVVSTLAPYGQSSSIAYVLSKDANYSPDDISLGSSTDVFATTTTSTPKLLLPGSVAGGNYYFIARINPFSSPLESTMSNNSKAVAVSVNPALAEVTINNLALLRTLVEQGSSFIPSVTEAFQGNIASGAHEVGFYLSSDSVYQSTDTYVGAVSVTSMSGGEKRTLTPSLTLAATTAPGSYYLLAVADHKKVAIDQNRDNNTKALPISVITAGIDLRTVTATVSASTIAPYISFSVTNTEHNMGISTAPAHKMAYYLSTDSLLDSKDYKIGSFACLELRSNHSKTYTHTLSVNQVFNAGNYFLLAIPDGDKTIAETNENNTKAIAVEVAASHTDLKVSWLSVDPTSVTQGSSFRLSYKLKNEGNLAAPYHTSRIYISTDAQYSTDDIQVFTAYHNNAGLTETAHTTNYLSLDKAIAVGKYFMIMVADDQNSINESNEANNTLSIPFEVIHRNIDLSLTFEAPTQKIFNPGEPISIYTLLFNKGTESTLAPGELYSFISKDSLLSADDIKVGQGVSSILANNSFSTIYNTAYLPYDIAAGDYYILLMADPQRLVVETNENNNLVFFKITINPYAVDLRILGSFDVKPYTAQGTTLDFNIYEYNDGSSYANKHHISYYLSKDSVLSSEATYLGGINVPPYAGKSYVSYYNNLSYNVSAQMEVGTYYIILVADDSSQVRETNEANNTKALKFQVLAPAKDLKTTSLTIAMQDMPPGAVVGTLAKCKNIGSLNLEWNTLGYYLSSDSLYDANDKLLGSVYVEALLRGDSITKSASLTIPGTTPLGSYFILAVADISNNHQEVDELNNVKALKINIVAPNVDLEVSKSPTMPKMLLWEVTSTISFQIKNNGNASSGKFNATIVLSKDSLLSSDDYTIYNQETAYPSKVSYTSDINFIPSANAVLTTPGIYYILVHLDKSNSIVELNETNNSLVILVDIQRIVRELATTSLTATPQAVNTNGSVRCTTTFVNTGNQNVSAGSGEARVYLSKDSLLQTSEDVNLKSMSLDGLVVNQAKTVSYNIQIPKGIASGTYYLIANIEKDPTELNLSDNAKAVKIDIINQGIDLVINQLTDTLNTMVSIGKLTPLLQEQNLGRDYVLEHKIGYYLSKDSIQDASDVFLSSSLVASLQLEPLDTIRQMPVLTIPGNTPAGDYYLIAVADYEKKIEETDETNNAKAYQIKVVAAVVDAAITVTETIYNWSAPNNYVSFYYNMQNKGNIPMARFDVTVYWSKDSIYDAQDIAVNGYRSFNVPPTLTPYRLSGSCKIPQNATLGKSYILLVADHEKLVNESNESNNMAKVEVMITENTFDVGIKARVDSSKLVYGEVVAGSILPLIITETNYGALPGTRRLVKISLSTDTLVNMGDRDLPAPFFEQMGGHTTLETNLSPKLPLFLAPGEYYVILEYDLDYFHYTMEDLDKPQNNKFILKIKVKRPDVDLKISGLQSEKAIYTMDYTMNLTIKEANIGSMPSERHYTNYYLSTDTLYSTNDISLGSILVNSIRANTDTTFNVSFSISSIPKGNYYILAITDLKNEMPESNETNNVKALQIKVEPRTNDLIVSGVHNIPKNLAAFETFVTASIDTKNIGELFYSSYNVGFYISRDSIFSIDDLWLASSEKTSHTPSKLDASTTATFNIPFGIPDGAYYIIAMADYNNEVTENNDTNNCRATKIYLTQPKADYIIKSIQSISSVALGAYFAPKVFIQNATPFPITSASAVSYYLSKDNILDTDDKFLAASEVPSFWGDTLSLTPNLLIPDGTPFGNYQILVMVDYLNTVAEANESNNFKAVALHISKVTGIAEVETSTIISLFPNPSSGIVYMDGFSEGLSDVEIHDVNSQLVRSIKQHTGPLHLDSLPQGVYFVTLHQDNRIYTGKLMIVK